MTAFPLVLIGILTIAAVVGWCHWQIRQTTQAHAAQIAALHDAVAEGLREAEQDMALDERAGFIDRAVQLCTWSDVIVQQSQQTKGYAVATKVGRC